MRICLLAYSISLTVFALLRQAIPAYFVVAVVGAFYFAFITALNTTLQARVHENVRGRVMALWSVAFLGSTPIGGPAAGAVAQYVGPRWGLGLGALACAVAALLGILVTRHRARSADARASAEIATEAEAEAVLEVAEAAR